ncbi:MAG: hypothetical protein LC100_12730 [Chitinophagales bacterium]|nr:hypothetical protein [Chitinophagales bacterium]
MDNHAVVSIAPGIKITTGTSSVCLGDAIPLTASLASEDGVSSGISSGLTSSKTIPDNDAAGVQSGIAINFVPANTIITNVIVRFKVTHPNIGDLVINLKGPNGNVINIANHMGGAAANFGNGYARALIDNLSSININMGTHPYTDKFYAPQADGGVQGATVVTNNISNVISLTDLFTGNSGAAANGNWVLSVRDDVAGNSGTLDVFEVRIDFAYTSNPLNVSWSASPDLFLDKNATIPYTSGTFASTVFAKPTATGTVNYSAISGTNGCVATKTITVNASPDLHLSADYCTPGGGTVRITANASPSPSPVVDKWIWNTSGSTDAGYSSYVDVTSAGKYYVSAKLSGGSCVSKAEISVSDNLVPNGNFEAGFTGFGTDYYPGANPFGVSSNANWVYSGFYGKDHTLGNGMGKFLILQAGAIGGVTNKVIWKRTGIPVKPSTRYYYSFWAMSLNNDATDAKLQIQINGTGTPISGTPLNTTITLPQGVNSNDNNGWQQYYGVWESGASTTSIDLLLVNDEANPKGIGIDDIAFGTLTSFFRLKSANATLDQTICEGTPITDVVFETGGTGTMPAISSGSLPPGVVAYWDGRNFRLSGSPNAAGAYTFTVHAEDCNPAPAFTQNVKITVTNPSNAGTLASGDPVIADCYGSSGSISLAGLAGTAQWQVSNDLVSWTNVGNGSYTNLNNTSYYRVIAQNTAACPKDTSSIVKLAVKNLWTGKSNTLWETGTNWSDNNYPLTSGCDVVIPQLPTARYPLLNSETVSVGNIEIKPNANVTVMGAALFDIAGNLTSTAGMDATDGTLKFSGTAAQTISGGMFVDTTIKKLIVNNNTGLNVAKSAGENALAITGKIELASGSAKLYSNGNTVLKSTKSHTASLGQVINSGQVNGEFTVERYINIGPDGDEHGKAWHVIAPNTSGQTIKQSWMENGDNVIEHYGINLTGAAGGDWDAVSPAPAIKYYVPGSGQGSWAGAPNSWTPLDSKSAWMVFIRGDRSVTGQWDDPKPTTLRSKGTIKTGTQTITVPGGALGFYLIGNPYPSAVDARTVTGLGTSGTYYVWNPNLGGNYGLGAYQTFTYDGNTGNYLSASGDTTANFIQSGQGFFVQTFSLPGTIEFQESDKVDASDNTMFFRGNGGSQAGMLRSNILSSDGTVQDGTLQFFSDDYSNEVDMADGRKMMNTGLNLSVKAKGQLLVVERRQHLNMEDTIFYNLTGIGNGKYSFALKTSDLSTTGLEGWLEDAFTGQRHPVNMDGITSVAFDVTSAAASKAANRFRMVFTSAFGPMPVTFVKVGAAKEGSEVRVKWDVANEINLQKYVVMRSADGNKFTDIVSVNAEGKTSYNALDRQPVSGYNYYRIRSVDKDGTEAYSSIVKVLIGSAEAKISVFPNPIVNGVVNLKLENMATGKYQARLLNPAGQVILTREINHPGGYSTERIPWDYKMPHGTYQLEVQQPDGSLRVIRILY